MVKFNDSMIYWLINHCTDWRHWVASLIFISSLIMYNLVTLTIDGVTSFLQLIDVQKVKYVFQSKKELQDFQRSIKDSGIIIDSEEFVHIFNLFMFKKL